MHVPYKLRCVDARTPSGAAFLSNLKVAGNFSRLILTQSHQELPHNLQAMFKVSAMSRLHHTACRVQAATFGNGRPVSEFEQNRVWRATTANLILCNCLSQIGLQHATIQTGHLETLYNMSAQVSRAAAVLVRRSGCCKRGTLNGVCVLCADLQPHGSHGVDVGRAATSAGQGAPSGTADLQFAKLHQPCTSAFLSGWPQGRRVPPQTCMLSVVAHRSCKSSRACCPQSGVTARP